MGGGGGKGGGSQNTQTVQKADPWSGQQPYLTDVFAQAQNLSQSPMPYYPGQAVAPFSPETQMALGLQDIRALEGSPVTTAGQQQIIDTLSGGYLGAGNPYFQGMMQNVGQAIIPQVASQFESSGRYGSGNMANAMSSAMANAATSAAYQNYEAERQNQIKSMLFAPQMAQQDYYDIAQLGQSGQIQEDQAQRQINAAMQQYQYGQMEPWQRLQMYSNLVQGNYGGTSTGSSTTSLPTQSPWQYGLGAASSLGGLGLLAYGLGLF